jgi:hypothetical protein
MRFFLRVPVLLAAAFFSAGAQGIGISVGTLVPQGDLADGAKTGFVGIASLEMGSQMALRVEALWANSDLKGRIITSADGVPVPENAQISGDVKFVGGLATLVFHLGAGPLRPYLLGGAGYYNRSGSQKAVDAAGELDELSLKESDLGFHAGAGIKVQLGGLAAFAEARYHRVNTDDIKTNFVPVVVGLRIGG